MISVPSLSEIECKYERTFKNIKPYNICKHYLSIMQSITYSDKKEPIIPQL